MLSDERMVLSFTIAAGPRQSSHSQFRVPRVSWLHFTVSYSRLLHSGGPGPPIYIPQEQGVPVIAPGTGYAFRLLVWLAGLRWRYSKYKFKADRIQSTSPNIASTLVFIFIKVKFTLLLAVSRQSVRLGIKPLETHDQRFFQLNPCCNSAYVTTSLTRIRVCLLWICLAFRRVYKCFYYYCPAQHFL
jgi:hypothetical protein